MARTRRNKGGDSGNTILLLGVAGVAFYGYLQGWFSGLFGIAVAAAAPAATGGTPAAPAIPKLGSVVTNFADLQAQAAANDPYIFPNAAILSTAPANYVLAADATTSETGTSNGQFYLRSDVANALLPIIGNGATLATLYQFPVAKLSDIQAIMTSKGMSGYNFAQFMKSRGY